MYFGQIVSSSTFSPSVAREKIIKKDGNGIAVFYFWDTRYAELSSESETSTFQRNLLSELQTEIILQLQTECLNFRQRLHWKACDHIWYPFWKTDFVSYRTIWYYKKVDVCGRSIVRNILPKPSEYSLATSYYKTQTNSLVWNHQYSSATSSVR